MHPQEAKRIRNGTGRLAHLALKNSELRIGLDFSENSRIQSLLMDPNANPFILYPGKTSKNIAEYGRAEFFKDGKTPLVFVIDGTWKAAKKIMKESAILHPLPRLSIHPQEPSRFIIKQQPNSLCLSTIESIYALLAELDKKGIESLEGRHQNLLGILDRLVQIQLDHIRNSEQPGYRRRDGTPYREKVFSKKPHKVSPFYK